MNFELRAVARAVIYGVLFAIVLACLHPELGDVGERNAQINACEHFDGTPLEGGCPTPGPNETP